MAADKKNGKDKEARLSQPPLTDEAVEQVKRAILFGVGYRRPPENTRFKKGQSGNPKGRPKTNQVDNEGGRSANALALKEAARLVQIREGEEIRQIPAIEAVHRAQYVSATKGNAYSQKHIIERYDWAERERRRQVKERIEFWERYVANYREAIAEAERTGNAPPNLLPHPDDVVFDDETGVRLVGPVDPEQVTQLEETCKVRDTLIMQNALDEREADGLSTDDPLDRPGTGLVFARVLNQSVPARYRLSDNEIIFRMDRYDRIPKRHLLKELYRAWRALGVKARRGKVLPPLRFAKQKIEQIGDLLAEIRAGGDVSQA